MVEEAAGTQTSGGARDHKTAPARNRLAPRGDHSVTPPAPCRNAVVPAGANGVHQSAAHRVSVVHWSGHEAKPG
jgi:hypothetical protein